MQLPEQPTPAVGQPTDRAQQIINAVEEVYAPQVFYRDESKPPLVGNTPPVAQPGRAPMSQRAVDLNTTILTSSVLATALGGSVTGILWASGQANPTVIAWVCGCAVAIPAALAVPVLAMKSLVKSAKTAIEASPPTIHQHYNGTVHQDTRAVTSHTRGIIANTRNTNR